MKNKKIWLFLALGCLLSGVFFALAGTLLGGIPGFYLDRSGIHTSREAADQRMNVFQNTVELDAFDSMELYISHAEDVELIPSDHYAVEYRTFGNSDEPVCRVENGRLIFQETASSPYSDSRIWFLYASPDFSRTKDPESGPYFVKISYPENQDFTDAVIRMESGNLKLPLLNMNSLEIRNEYGDVSMEDWTGNTLNLFMSSGNLTAGTVAADQAQLENEYGSVALEGYTGNTLDICMSSGNLSVGSVQAEQTTLQNEYGEILIGQASGDSLNANLSSGSLLADRLDVTDLKVKNEYGTVRVRLPEEISGYGYQLKTEYGSILLDGRKLTDSDEDENEASYSSAGTNGKTVEISCSSGDIIIDPVP